MTVKEAIEKLKQFPEDKLIYIPAVKYGHHAREIREGRNHVTKGMVVVR